MTILKTVLLVYYTAILFSQFSFLVPWLVQIADGWISVRLREDNGALGDILLEKI